MKSSLYFLAQILVVIISVVIFIALFVLIWGAYTQALMLFLKLFSVDVLKIEYALSIGVVSFFLAVGSALVTKFLYTKLKYSQLKMK